MTERMKRTPLHKENHVSFENILESIRNLHMQQRQNRHSTQEPNQNTLSAPQIPRIQVNQEEAKLIMFTPIVEQQVPPVQGGTGIQENPK